MIIKENRFSTFIWILLVLLTLSTYLIGEAGAVGKISMLLLITLSFLKGQLVANYFMNLRHAHGIWRTIIFAYFLVVGGLIAITYINSLN